MRGWYVYVASDGDAPVKIGISLKPTIRANYLSLEHKKDLKIVRRWNLTYEGATKVERIAHVLLNNVRLNGEWFNCDDHTAIETIDKIISKTNNGRTFAVYGTELSFPERSRKIGGDASARARVKRTKQRAELIRKRWLQSPVRYPTAALLAEAKIGRNAAKKYLGKRMKFGHALEEAAANTAKLHLGSRKDALRYAAAATKRKAKKAKAA